MINVANLSGGGAGAVGFELSVLSVLDSKGVSFSEVYGVSGGCLAGLLYATFGAEKAIDVALNIPDTYDPDFWAFILPWKRTPSGLVHYEPLREYLLGVLTARTLQKKLVLQSTELFSKESVYRTFYKGEPAADAVQAVIDGMSIPGLVDVKPKGGKLYVDSGATENSVAIAHMPTDAMIWTISVHGRESINFTEEDYTKAGVIEMLGQTTGSMSYVMYRDDKEALHAKYKSLRFIEATKKLEVFSFSRDSIQEAIDHGKEVMNGN